MTNVNEQADEVKNIIAEIKSFDTEEMSETIALLETKCTMDQPVYDALKRAKEAGVLAEVVKFVHFDLNEKQWASPRSGDEAMEKNSKVMTIGSEISKAL